MFGLSMREKAMKIVENAYINNINVYEQEISSLLRSSPGEFTAIEEEKKAYAKNVYLFSVWSTLQGVTLGAHPNVKARFELFLRSPSVCGYKGIDLKRPLTAGQMYAAVYYAFSGDTALPKHCEKLDCFADGLILSTCKKYGIAVSHIPKRPMPPMKWYYFYLKILMPIQLIFSSIALFLGGINTYTALYGQAAYAMMPVSLIAILLMFFTRRQLLRFQKSGLTLLYITSLYLFLLYFIAATIDNANYGVTWMDYVRYGPEYLIGQLLGAVCFPGLNALYFYKRRHLFTEDGLNPIYDPRQNQNSLLKTERRHGLSISNLFFQKSPLPPASPETPPEPSSSPAEAPSPAASSKGPKTVVVSRVSTKKAAPAPSEKELSLPAAPPAVSQLSSVKAAKNPWKIAACGLALALCVCLGAGGYFGLKYQKLLDDYTSMEDKYSQQIVSLTDTKEHYEEFLASAYSQLNTACQELIQYYTGVAFSNSYNVGPGTTVHVADCPYLNDTCYIFSSDYARQQGAVLCSVCQDRIRKATELEYQSYSNAQRYENYADD